VSYLLKHILRWSDKIIITPFRFRGFIVSDFHDKYEDDFYAEIPKQISSGGIKIKEYAYQGLEKVPEAFQGMLSGAGFGKVLIKVAEE
jgi:NADPH-dependent curcumin reductase